MNILFFIIIAFIDVSFTSNMNFHNYTQDNATNPFLKIKIRRDAIEKIKKDFHNYYLQSIIKSINPFDVHGVDRYILTNITIQNFTWNLAETTIQQLNNTYFQINFQEVKMPFLANANITYLNNKNYKSYVQVDYQCQNTQIILSFFNENNEIGLLINKVYSSESYVTYVWAEKIKNFDYIRQEQIYDFNRQIQDNYNEIIKYGLKNFIRALKQKKYIDLDIKNQIQINRQLSNFPFLDSQALTIESYFRVHQQDVQQKTLQKEVSLPVFNSNIYEIDIMISQDFFNSIAHIYYQKSLLNFIFSKEQNNTILNTNQFKSVFPALIFKYGINKPMRMNLTVTTEPIIEISQKFNIIIDLQIQIDFYLDNDESINKSIDPIFSIQSKINLVGIAQIIKKTLLQFDLKRIDLKTFQSYQGELIPSTLFQISGQQIIEDILEKMIPAIQKEIFCFGFNIQDVISEYFNIKNPKIIYQDNYLRIGAEYEQIQNDQFLNNSQY